MAIFFLVAGLEIKRELLVGELSSVRKAAVPIVAAIGGMVGPAMIYAELGTPKSVDGVCHRHCVCRWCFGPAGQTGSLGVESFLLLGHCRRPLCRLGDRLFYTESLYISSFGIGGLGVAGPVQHQRRRNH